MYFTTKSRNTSCSFMLLFFWYNHMSRWTEQRQSFVHRAKAACRIPGEPGTNRFTLAQPDNLMVRAVHVVCFVRCNFEYFNVKTWRQIIRVNYSIILNNKTIWQIICLICLELLWQLYQSRLQFCTFSRSFVCLSTHVV